MKHPISTQVWMDIKVAQKLRLPWQSWLPLGAVSLALIWFCDHLGRLNMALPIWNCIAVFALLIYLKRELRRQPLFWTTIALLGTLHAMLIWYIPWTSKWVPALAIATISSVDFCLMLWVLAAVETMLQGQQAVER